MDVALEEPALPQPVGKESEREDVRPVPVLRALPARADLALGRPLGLAAIIVGSVVFVISSPFSALGGNFSTAADKLVVDPVMFTFKRPLGEF